MKNLLTREFLESKLAYYEHKYYGTCLHKASSGNIDRISDNVFKFTQYNFLPETDGQLYGHYTFYVNVTNFKYLLYKSSFYGSLTYTTESLDKNWVTNLIERELIEVESIIADKILGSYFYDSNDVNQKGKSLINDGYKKCLITDYRGYIWSDLKPNEKSDKDIEAIKLLDPEYKIREVKSYKLGKIEEKILLEEIYIIEGKKPKEMKLNNIQYLVPIDIEYTDNSIDKIYFARELTGLYSRNFLFLDKDKKKMMEYSSNYRGKPSNIIKIIPEFIKSL
jgi:hypothetical protein